MLRRQLLTIATPRGSVCPHCRSSTCDTLQDEFTRHAIEPELTASATIDNALESGFSGVSQVSAGADVEAFVEGYKECPDFKLTYSSIKGLEEGKKHDHFGHACETTVQGFPSKG